MSEKDEKPKQVLSLVMRQVLSTKAQRIKQGACQDCGLQICPGARAGRCAAQKATAEEWDALKKTKWV